MVINMETEHIYEKDQLYQIALSDLQTDPNQPRKVIDPQSLEELTTSIARMGVVQPVVFRQMDGLLRDPDATLNGLDPVVQTTEDAL
jgi:hypothetical protein